MQKIILPSNIDVVIASYGGVGTTFLLRHIGKYRQVNHLANWDDLKHSPIPPVSFSPKVKFVYIYGDPVLAAVSLFRRGVHHGQSKNLQKYVRSGLNPINPNMTLEDYAKQGVDQFCFRIHFKNWYEKYLRHPTVFIRYETIFENASALADFLELPKKAVSEFPKKKKRSSSIFDIPEETAEGIKNIYAKLSAELNELDDFVIRRSRENEPLMKTLFRPPYMHALFNQFFDGLRQASKRHFPEVYNKLKTVIK